MTQKSKWVAHHLDTGDWCVHLEPYGHPGTLFSHENAAYIYTFSQNLRTGLRADFIHDRDQTDA